MSPIETEARLVVIEVPCLPGPGAVACLAFDAEYALVDIFLLVAAVAVALSIAERRGQMAFLAFDPDVAACQRETGTVVIELVDFPAVLLVTGIAASTQLTLVPLFIVILAMAGIAVGRQLL